jgi:DNA-binding XRE family transcriptional regulator
MGDNTPIYGDILMERHARLKMLRILHGFTRTEFAQLANIPVQSISAMETGKYAPTGETGMLVAMALRVPYDYLYVGTPSVDYAAPCLWKPAPPVRSLHLQAMTNEVKVLFPLFLIENEFDSMVSAQLSGGDFAFLIGRRPKDSRLKAKVSCLLLVSQHLASSFLFAFETAGVSINVDNRSQETVDENTRYYSQPTRDAR